MSAPLVSAEVAVEQLRRADERWAAAVRGVASYSDRLRELADAAEHESRALTLATLADVEWIPRRGARNMRLEFEVEKDSGRPGPPQLWARFDRAVKQLGLALEGDQLKPIAAAFDDLAAVTRQLADANAAQQPDGEEGEKGRKAG